MKIYNKEGCATICSDERFTCRQLEQEIYLADILIVCHNPPRGQNKVRD